MKKFKLACLFVAFSFGVAAFAPISAAAKSACQTNGWEVLYTLDFPPAYWVAGPHENDLKVVDSSGTSLTSHPFQSTYDAPLYAGQVRIGFFGIRWRDIGGLGEINPAQDSFMQVTFGFATREEARAYADSTIVQFSWDGGEWIDIPPRPVNCAPGAFSDQVGYYYRHWR